MRAVVSICCALFCGLFFAGCSSTAPIESWQRDITRQLGMLGSRNWIIIAEPSFPAFSGTGTRVIVTDEPIPKLYNFVMNSLEMRSHVEPRIFVASELPFLKEEYAPGILQYRKQLSGMLLGRNYQEAHNNTLMKLMDDASHNYNVLVIKSSTALPYSNIFIELDSGYWNSESETALRREVEKPTTTPSRNLPQ